MSVKTRARRVIASLLAASGVILIGADAELWTFERLHALGEWYHVAAVYDGREFRNYVNGVQEGAAQIRLDPQGPGRSSIGVRINLVNYFKGAIRAARFSRRALAPAEFLPIR